ncbi:MAG: UDP-N-acetylmuramate dehydrogenase [Clostridia bacterium]|nr:UDP-N-acetylmuramate dehydrogenase [Clostridia bacterium]
MQNKQLLVEYFSKLSDEGRLEFKENALLSEYASFKIGGPAAFVVFPYDSQTLVDVYSYVDSLGTRVLVFGNASNVLFCDDGIDGVVIFTGKMKQLTLDDEGIIHADAGVNLLALSQFAHKNGFKGHEFLFGIPGNCGGAVFMNAGAYEHCISEVLYAVTYFDAGQNKIVRAMRDELEFSYRESSFRMNSWIVLSIEVKLEKADDPDAVKALMDDHLRTRNCKQPLEYPSAGSVFKRYPGYYTSKLIDEAGLKGTTVGGAQVSEKHAGFIVNRGGATARDVMMLIKLIQDRIYAVNGIHIECEVIYVV